MKKSVLAVLMILSLLSAAISDSSVNAQGVGPNQFDYHSYNSLVSDLNRLAGNHPDIAKVYEIGTSVEGRQILAIKISDNAAGDTDEGENEVLFIGAHHAREWISLEVPYLLAKYMVENYNDSQIKPLIDNQEIWVIPLLNPDGYEHSRNNDRMWRKNRHHYAIPWSPDCNGVDLNRNYGSSMWGTINNSVNSRSCRSGPLGMFEEDTYIGPYGFSEPETQVIRDFCQEHRIDAVLSYHSYLQLILYPWGYTKDEMSNVADREFMQELAKDMRDAILAVHGETYIPQQSSDLYRTAGDLTDWSYETYGIPSFTIELRPDSAFPGFELPANEIDETFEENLPAALVLLEAYLPTIQAPSTSNPVNAGPYASPHKIALEISGVGKGRTATDFTVKIGGAEATIVSAVRTGVNQYVLGVMPPDQSANGLYDLEVATGGSLSEQPNAVIYTDVSNADVMLVIDRSGSMESSGYLEPAKEAAKQFVNFMQEGDRVGVASFDDDPFLDFPLTAIVGGTSPPTFSDDMENGDGNWTADSPWAITTERANSPTHAWSDSLGGDYSNYTDASLVLNTSFDLTTINNPTLSFWTWLDLETSYDRGRMEVSTDGGTSWTEITYYTGHDMTWKKKVVSLANYSTETDLRIRFRLTTDSSVTNDGWYIDDVQIGEDDTRQQVERAIDGILAGGWTSIGAGLDTAQDQLINNGDPMHPWAIVLLSDGYENEPPWVADVLPDILTSKTVVHTIALGPDSDQNLLLDIVSQTGGTYSYAPDAEALASTYNTIVGQVSGQQVLFSEQGEVDQGQIDEKNVMVDAGIYEATFSVTWSDPNANLDLTLVGPGGTVIDPAVAASDPDIDFYTGATYEYYRVRDPLAGSWTTRTYGVSTLARVQETSSQQTYTAQVTGRTDTTLDFYIDQESYLVGDRVQMTAVLADEQPITGGTIEVDVSTATISQTVTLYDDGLHDDGAANDGVYANVFENTTVSGIYTFDLRASGISNSGAPFTRLASTTFNVSEPPEPAVEATGSPPVTAEPGDVLAMNFEVKNTSSSWDTFDLRVGEVETILGWADESSIPNSVSLYPGQSVFYNITVTVPTTASRGSQFVLPLIAVSQSDVDISDIATIEVSIPFYEVHLPLIVRNSP